MSVHQDQDEHGDLLLSLKILVGWSSYFIAEVSTVMTEVQRSWAFLENLFIHSEEVKKELPDESERFVGIDMDVKELLAKGFVVNYVEEC